MLTGDWPTYNIYLHALKNRLLLSQKGEDNHVHRPRPHDRRDVRRDAVPPPRDGEGQARRDPREAEAQVRVRVYVRSPLTKGNNIHTYMSHLYSLYPSMHRQSQLAVVPFYEAQPQPSAAETIALQNLDPSSESVGVKLPPYDARLPYGSVNIQIPGRSRPGPAGALALAAAPFQTNAPPSTSTSSWRSGR